MSSSNTFELSTFPDHSTSQTADQQDQDSNNFEMSSEDYEISIQQSETSANKQHRFSDLERTGGLSSPIEDQNQDDDLDQEFNLPRTIEYMGHPVVLESTNVLVSWKLKFQSMTCFQFLLVVGFMDQTIGSIMHYMLEYYQVDRSQLSLLFLLQLFGYLTASFANEPLQKRMGLGNLTNLAMFCLMTTCLGFYLKFPLILMFILSMFSGFGIGTVDCCLNLFVGNLKYANQLLGVMHAFYGLETLERTK
ncbi:unnamed protein product [Ambrosiozyma monospora]|uniref:Unnamed protein product n=1 Tax=Ambrosiozyma monospora TaxID=43982 RepID=A0ACB5TT83_AMBMO|nr:unnamed protein product [Ambrosiozyma monospora]